MPSGVVVNGVPDTIEVILEILATAEREIVFIAPPSFPSLAGIYDTIQSAERFIEDGGVLRGITTVSPASIEETNARLAVGIDFRHSEHTPELFMFVGDKRFSISAVNIGTEEFTRDTPVTAFWSESPTYAEYLSTSFEGAWSTAVPAQQRIRELEEQSE